MDRLFLDTSYAVALASPRDRLHARAVSLAEHIRRDATRLVTTHAVVLEIGDGLSAARYRRAAVRLVESIQRDTRIEVIALTEQLFDRSIALFRDRPDKEWGLTDCVSFIVMADLGLTDALTADHLFEQAGFRALLRSRAPQ